MGRWVWAGVCRKTCKEARVGKRVWEMQVWALKLAQKTTNLGMFVSAISCCATRDAWGT